MNFFQRLRFLIFGTPYVLLHVRETYGADHMFVRPVHFINGTPYSTYQLGEHCRSRLLPHGLAVGYYSVRGWEPATPNMNYYFNPPAE